MLSALACSFLPVIPNQQVKEAKRRVAQEEQRVQQIEADAKAKVATLITDAAQEQKRRLDDARSALLDERRKMADELAALERAMQVRSLTLGEVDYPPVRAERVRMMKSIFISITIFRG